MEEIDSVRADNLEIGDCILFDGSPGEIKEIEEIADEYFFVSEDDREISYRWSALVAVFGYPDVDI